MRTQSTRGRQTPPPNIIPLLRSTHSALLVRPASGSHKKRRFYSLQLAPGFFDEWAVAKEWGAYGDKKTTWSLEWYRTEEQARLAFRKRIQESFRRGFDLVTSHGNV